MTEKALYLIGDRINSIIINWKH